jgi:hypothetical protein
MKKYTSKDVENSKSFMESRGFKKFEEILNNETFSYYLLPQFLNSDLPDFVYQCISNDDYVLGISESLPKDYRKYFLYHELLEYRDNPDTKGRCKIALEKELSLVSEDIKDKYIKRRLNFFKNLIDYSIKNKSSSEDIEEFNKSLKFLEELSK